MYVVKKVNTKIKKWDKYISHEIPGYLAGMWPFIALKLVGLVAIWLVAVWLRNEKSIDSELRTVIWLQDNELQAPQTAKQSCANGC